MKNFASILIAASLIAALTGCADSSSKNQTNPVITATESDTVTLPSSDSDSLSKAEADVTDSNVYNKEAVLDAYKSGDASHLNDFNLQILDKLKVWLSDIYQDGMSEEEIVIAAHDYIVTHCLYDTSALSPFHKKVEHTDSPYGVMVSGYGICSGYTSTFQLLMDAIGIECVSVSGEALDEEHAWNMVRLDSEWYHVDCTWDDFVPDFEARMPFHMYLLVDDSTMEVSHIWEHDSAPSASSMDKYYLTQSGLYADNVDDLNRLVSEAKRSGQQHAEIVVPKNADFDFPTSQDAHAYAVWNIDMGEYNVNVYYLTEDVLNLPM